MDCRRAEELLSDHFEGTLAEPLLSDLERHLLECAACRALREALAQVVESLRDFPVLDPPADLAARAATAALAHPRAAARPLGVSRPPLVRHAILAPAWLQAAAAGIALVTTGLVLLTSGTQGPSRVVTRAFDRGASAGAYLMERKDRLVEDIRILRVVISTAFEGRLDRMSDRVDDYRRLLERRRLSEEEQKKNRGSNATTSLGRLARTAPVFRTGPGADS